jgi:hypothetical protein
MGDEIFRRTRGAEHRSLSFALLGYSKNRTSHRHQWRLLSHLRACASHIAEGAKLSSKGVFVCITHCIDIVSRMAHMFVAHLRQHCASHCA